MRSWEEGSHPHSGRGALATQMRCREKSKGQRVIRKPSVSPRSAPFLPLVSLHVLMFSKSSVYLLGVGTCWLQCTAGHSASPRPDLTPSPPRVRAKAQGLTQLGDMGKSGL